MGVLGGNKYFSADYATARRRLVRASQGRAVHTVLPIDATGPLGEGLSIDVFWQGPSDAKRVVVTTSGIHGVEGFFGSACQLAWFKKRCPFRKGSLSCMSTRSTPTVLHIFDVSTKTTPT